MCSHVAKQMHQRKIYLIFQKISSIYSPFLAGLGCNMVNGFPREEEKMEVPHCCDGQAGSSDLRQDSSSQRTR